MPNKIEITPREIKVFTEVSKPKGENHNSKIPKQLLTVVHRMRVAGKTLEELRTFLQNEHKIAITVSALSKRLRKAALLNQAVTEAIYTQSAVQGADEIVSIMDASILELKETHEALLKSGNFGEARMYRETLLKYISKKMDMANVSSKKEERQQEETSDIDELLAKLDNTLLHQSEQSYQLATQDVLPQVVEAEYEHLMKGSGE